MHLGTVCQRQATPAPEDSTNTARLDSATNKRLCTGAPPSRSVTGPSSPLVDVGGFRSARSTRPRPGRAFVVRDAGRSGGEGRRRIATRSRGLVQMRRPRRRMLWPVDRPIADPLHAPLAVQLSSPPPDGPSPCVTRGDVHHSRHPSPPPSTVNRLPATPSSTPAHRPARQPRLDVRYPGTNGLGRHRSPAPIPCGTPPSMSAQRSYGSSTRRASVGRSGVSPITVARVRVRTSGRSGRTEGARWGPRARRRT